MADLVGCGQGGSRDRTDRQQRGELEKQQPVEVRDPATNEVYVLLRKEVYEGVQRIVREVNERADWDDPAFDVCDRDLP
jgi:hypothetical protein